MLQNFNFNEIKGPLKLQKGDALTYLSLVAQFFEEFQADVIITDLLSFFTDLDQKRIIHLRTKKFPSISVSVKGQRQMLIKTTVYAVVHNNGFYKLLSTSGQNEYLGWRKVLIDNLYLQTTSHEVGDQPIQILILLETPEIQNGWLKAFISGGVYVQSKIIMDPQRLQRFDYFQKHAYYNWFQPHYLWETKRINEDQDLINFLNQPYNHNKRLNPFYIAVVFPQHFYIFYDKTIMPMVYDLIEFYFTYLRKEQSKLSQQQIMKILIKSTDPNKQSLIQQLYGFPNNPNISTTLQMDTVESDFEILDPEEIMREYLAIYKLKARDKKFKDLNLTDPDYQRRGLQFKIKTLMGNQK